MKQANYKLDKLGKVAGQQAIAAYKRHLLHTWEELPPVFITSSEDGRGREEILNYIEQINMSLNND